MINSVCFCFVFLYCIGIYLFARLNRSMQPISVVIITKNAAHLLAPTLQSVKSLTDDIVVCDTGSNDATIPVAVKNGASVIEEKWRGHGLTKNIANEQAVYDWILQIDADEIVDAAAGMQRRVGDSGRQELIDGR